jgi:hypothetical protein
MPPDFWSAESPDNVLPLPSYRRRVPGMNSSSPCAGALLRRRILEADISGYGDAGLTLPASLYLTGQHVAEVNDGI